MVFISYKILNVPTSIKLLINKYNNIRYVKVPQCTFELKQKRKKFMHSYNNTLYVGDTVKPLNILI